jgi:hypothetical protein
MLALGRHLGHRLADERLYTYHIRITRRSVSGRPVCRGPPPAAAGECPLERLLASGKLLHSILARERETASLNFQGI